MALLQDLNFFYLTNTPIQTVTFSLIDNVESRASDLQAQGGSLKGTLTIAIESYDGLSLSRKRSIAFPRRAIAEAVAA